MNIPDYSSEMKPAVSIVAQDDARRHRLSRVAEAAGGSIFRAMNHETALAHLKQGRPTGTLLVDLDEGEEQWVDPLMAAARLHLARDHEAMILSGPASMLDRLSAIGMDPRVTWLCQPSDEDRVAALALDLSRSPYAFADVSTELDTQRLRRLADEVSRIARTLANISGPRPIDGFAPAMVAESDLTFRAEPMGEDSLPDAEEVRRMLRLRRLRDSFFDPALFADPAWDMLLDLLAARIERAQVAVSSLCIAAAVPPTTVLRWIKTMTDHGLFERCADPEDGRRIFIQLSDHAAAAMSRYFAAARRVAGQATVMA